MGNYVTEVNSQNFDEVVLKSTSPVLVDFWAPWCGPCRAVAPVVEAIAQEYENKIKVAKLNVDDSPDIANKYFVTSIPTIFIFKDGKILDQTVGAVNKSFLREFIDKQVNV